MKYIKLSAAFFIIIILTFSGCNSKNHQDEAAVIEETSVPSTIPMATDMPELLRTEYHYIISDNDEKILDDSDLALPGYLDIVSFNKSITETEIVLFIELRDLPAVLNVNQSGILKNTIEYSWRVNFDVDCDNTVAYDISLIHYRLWNKSEDEIQTAPDDLSFLTEGIQHQINTGQTIAEGIIKIDKNTIILNFSKTNNENLSSITADTPIHILAEYNSGEVYLYDIIPKP